jgi:Flp pilus assembly pilin Flp
VWGLNDLRNRLSRDRRGAALIEYALLISLVTLTGLGFIVAVGSRVNAFWAAILR